jgi:hypothetical protein
MLYEADFDACPSSEFILNTPEPTSIGSMLTVV